MNPTLRKEVLSIFIIGTPSSVFGQLKHWETGNLESLDDKDIAWLAGLHIIVCADNFREPSGASALNNYLRKIPVSK
jgi:hypothetical protein